MAPPVKPEGKRQEELVKTAPLPWREREGPARDSAWEGEGAAAAV